MPPNATIGQASRSSGVTSRSLVIGILLIPINYYWIVQLEVVRYTFPTIIAPFFNVIFTLVLLMCIRWLLSLLGFRGLLDQRELLVIYVMLSVASGICSNTTTEQLITYIGHPFWFATPENEWHQLFWQYLPQWLTISDKRVLADYYNGDSTFYTSDHLRGWLTPVLWWSLFILALMVVMLCINIVLRRQWVDRERLTYPIIQLPLEMTSPSSRFFMDRLMWIGFAIAAAIGIINGLHELYSSVPYIPVKRQNIGYLFTGKPWNAVGNLTISFYPFALGLGFLMPLDLSFSCWFFYLFAKGELILTSILGLQQFSGMPYFQEQVSGALITLFVGTLWVGRKHLRNVLLIAFGREHEDHVREPVSYRFAVLGIFLGLCALITFSLMGGMSIWVAAGFLGIYFALSTVITRMRAELGFPVHTLAGVGPHFFLVRLFGTRRFGGGTLTMLSMYTWFNNDYEGHPMPHMLEGYKAADSTRIDRHKLSWAIFVAVIVGIPATFWTLLHQYYRFGADTGRMNIWTLGFARNGYGYLENWLRSPQSTDYRVLAFMGLGAVFALFLSMMRVRFIWWPFHPLGYIMGSGWGMANLWTCMAASFLAKWLVVKYGGLRAYRKAIPFFLGLILGDYLVGSLWSIISIIFGVSTYQFWP